ncbi:hypothetical protein DFJ77DRAFT_546374 [Powellomyces hirtus]|nr:hypothetical protein DFJ77DRAFT_546374 [Powellomyces hirtus]
MVTFPFRVLISGAGIGGLAASLALERANPSTTVTIVEQAHQLLPVGAGIHPMDCLSASPWACFWHCDRAGVQPPNCESGVDVRLGHRITNVAEVADSREVLATFDAQPPFTADVVIGADGLRSAIRAQHFEADKSAAPVYSGFSCVFGITSEINDANEGEVVWVFDKGRVYGRWPMKTTGSTEESLKAAASHDSKYLWSNDDVNHEMRRLRESYHPYDVNELMDKTTRAIKFGLFETTLPGAYTNGSRIFLLGDSAHPMVPYAGQGANLATEDAACLSTLLANCRTNSSTALGDDAVVQTSSNPVFRTVNLFLQRNMTNWLMDRSSAWMYTHHTKVVSGV